MGRLSSDCEQLTDAAEVNMRFPALKSWRMGKKSLGAELMVILFSTSGNPLSLKPTSMFVMYPRYLT